ncbi:UDP-N-acetylmuramoylalanine--D-glutamate ligase [Ruminococcaceae bacterium YRB3002]|nr:UDP-N-acetylmuramoylalanine--D-glutamate ligase [Ruminococcaceae bacterium YRB3002]
MNNKYKKFCKYIKGRRAAVVGVGISNKPLIRWLAGLGADITAFDSHDESEPSIASTVSEFKADNIKVTWSLGGDYLKPLRDETFDIVFKTPKMRFTVDALETQRRKGAILTTEMELFLDLCPAETFGITGSDGKTTTTTIVYEILKTAGYNCYLGGNIGTPLLDQIANITPEDKVILELSSFQLLGMKRSVDNAIVTNITPNHLDFHYDYAEYISAKKNIFATQGATGKLVLNAMNDLTYDLRNSARGRVSYFSGDTCVTLRENYKNADIAFLDEEGYLCIQKPSGITRIIHRNDILVPGYHNVQNYLAAIALTSDLVSADDVVAVAKSFKGVQHRIEFVRELDGVRWYNSSIDTSPNRTINTMNALSERGMHGVLLCGGKDKQCVYEGLGDAILKFADRIVIYGSNAELIRQILDKEADGRKFEVFVIEGGDEVYELPDTREAALSRMKEAVDKARSLAKSGEVVIMSNVGTSYDHFRHFEHRGDLYKELVNGL